MIRLEWASEFHSEIICSIIAESFKKQAQILCLSKEQHPGFVAFDTVERVRRRIKQGDGTAIAYLGKDPVGTITCAVDPVRPEKGYVRRLAVLPRQRGNSIGQLLMDHALKRLKEQKVIFVELSIVAQFDSLREYYQRMGFLCREKKSFPHLPFEVLYMEKILG